MYTTQEAHNYKEIPWEKHVDGGPLVIFIPVLLSTNA